jgi:phosphoribosylformylglycinamidine synthase
MKDWEILLSESQERMLVVVEKGKEKVVNDIFDKWDLSCEEIGVVTEGERVQYFMHDELVADVPCSDLVLGGGAPVYEREYKEPEYFKRFQEFKIDNVKEPEDLIAVANFLTENYNIASKKWVYEQYDSMVGTANMSTNFPTDAGIVNLRESSKALAMTVDCNSRMVNANPEEGCAMAVAEAARNIVCSGGSPSAITNCLNFGNPYNPEVYWQFVGSIKGMSKACRKFSTPVTGGNVSFYNQSSIDGREVPVFPTPTIGMLGIVEDKKHITTLAFQNSDSLIYLLGDSLNDISCSEYLVAYHKINESSTPFFDLDVEFELQQSVSSLIKEDLIISAHDVSDGGLFITLLESSMANNLGFSINSDDNIRKDAFLFGESPSRVVVSIDNCNKKAFETLLSKTKTSFHQIGTVTEGDLLVDGELFGNVSDYKQKFDTSLTKKMS